MSALPPADHRKLVGILSRLGSDAEGERAAAGLLASELIARHGKTWADLLPPLPSRSMACSPKDERRERYPERAGPPARYPLLRQHQLDAGMLLQSPYRWDDWQRKFLSDMLNSYGPISVRQQDKLRECRRLADATRERRAA